MIETANNINLLPEVKEKCDTVGSENRTYDEKIMLFSVLKFLYGFLLWIFKAKPWSYFSLCIHAR